jgi:hypothetical protein
VYIHNYPQNKNGDKALFCPAFEQLMNNYFTDLYTGSTDKMDRKLHPFWIDNKKAEIT